MQVDQVCYTVVSDTPQNYLCNHIKSSCIPFGCKGWHFFYLGSPTTTLYLLGLNTTEVYSLGHLSSLNSPTLYLLGLNTTEIYSLGHLSSLSTYVPILLPCISWASTQQRSIVLDICLLSVHMYQSTYLVSPGPQHNRGL